MSRMAYSAQHRFDMGDMGRHRLPGSFGIPRPHRRDDRLMVGDVGAMLAGLVGKLMKSIENRLGHAVPELADNVGEDGIAGGFGKPDMEGAVGLNSGPA